LFEAAHWTAVVLAGMLAVLILSWAIALATPEFINSGISNDLPQPVNPTF
jgi:hypothetical protein